MRYLFLINSPLCKNKSKLILINCKANFCCLSQKCQAEWRIFFPFGPAYRSQTAVKYIEINAAVLLHQAFQRKIDDQTTFVSFSTNALYSSDDQREILFDWRCKGLPGKMFTQYIFSISLSSRPTGLLIQSVKTTHCQT